jgi:hypothetical protein
MAEASPDKIVVSAIGPLITTVIGAAIAWLSGGADVTGRPLMVLLTAVGGISGLVFSLMYKRYIGVLGAGGGRKGYPARDAYEALRASLSGGNLASRLYADWLTKFLDAVDRFFGDAGWRTGHCLGAPSGCARRHRYGPHLPSTAACCSP